MLRKRFTVIGSVFALTVALAIGSQVQVVDQWALYTASGPNEPLRLFLEPFPMENFCHDDAVAIVRNGGRAECRKRVNVTLDRRPADKLLWEFVAEWAHVCGPQVADR